MRNVYTLLAACALASTPALAQMQYYLDSGFATRFNDINDNGLAVTPSRYFDFPTLTFILEPEAVETVALNNNGDVAGSLWLDEEAFIFQPGYRKNGVWNPIGWFPESNPAESSFSTFAISESGEFITGQMSIGFLEFGTFLYNTETEVLTSIFDPAYVAVAGYAVNSNGIIGGWADDEPEGGTRRIPCYITPDLEIVLIPGAEEPQFNTNAVNAINESNVMAGDFDNQPFIYDLNTNTFQTFEIPFGFTNATFTSISENGIAVGYAQFLGEFGNPTREALIYHPDLGSQPILLKDILLINGIDINTDDGRMGTAIAISPNGEYVAGWPNIAPFFAPGWIVYFNELLFVEPVCSFDCPENLSIITEDGFFTAIVDYEVNYTCGPNAPAEVNLVQVEGLPSGSVFPLGNTVVLHHLVDGDGNVLAICNFVVSVSDSYCAPMFFFSEPITQVTFAGIDNTTTADISAPVHEFFLDIVGNVAAGGSYDIALEGNTGGDFINFFTVFIDWNQNDVFDAGTDVYEIGSITNSTGTDGQQATGTITVPADATLGNTRMRVIKNWETAALDPCMFNFFGQAEDYTINVTDDELSTAAVDKTNLSLYPNPVADVLRLRADIAIRQVSVYNAAGQMVLQQTLETNIGEINFSGLARGVYAVTATADGYSNTFKIVKL